MTSIEWFVEQLEEHLLSQDIVLQLKNTEAFEQAKEMHKQEIINSYRVGACEVDKIGEYKANKYYQEIFVSKGSDDHISDISKMVKDDVDKLQQDAWDNYEHEEGNLYSTTFRNAFKLGYKKAKEHYELAASVRELKEYKLGFNCGYKQAKENTFTEEQLDEKLRKAIEMARESMFEFNKKIPTSDEIIQSLKQPKKD